MPAGKPFRIRRQNSDGETLHVPATNACRACYKPLPNTRESYCDTRCSQAHTRLRGAA